MLAKKRSLITLFCLTLLDFHSFPGDSTRWQTEVMDDAEIKVVSNPREPLFGDVQYELIEDLAIGCSDVVDYKFSNIRDIAVDGKGAIYVADMDNHRVQKFDANGKYLQTIGGTVRGFDLPIKVRIDEKSGCVYVKNGVFNHEMFSQDGDYLKRIVVDKATKEFIVDGSGFIIADPKIDHDDGIQSAVAMIDLNGRIMWIYEAFEYEKIRDEQIKTDVFVGHDIYLARLSSGGFVYGWAKEYDLKVIDERGDLILKIIKETPKAPSDNNGANSLETSITKYRQCFYSITTDSNDRIYVQTNRTFNTPQDVEREYDLFGKDGIFLYRTKLPHNTCAIRGGRLYCYLKDGNVELVKRYVIRNWNAIRDRL